MAHSDPLRRTTWIRAGLLALARALALALAMAGCGFRQAADDKAVQPARLTIELSGTATTPGSLWLQVESVVLMPKRKLSLRSLNPERVAADHPAFFFALSADPFVLDADGAILAREVRVAPGRYRELRLRLGPASVMETGERRVPVSGGGSVPLDLELTPGEAATLAIRIDGPRSLRDSGSGAMVFDPVLLSAAVLPGAAEAHGAIRGRVIPPDAGAMIVIYGSDASDSRSFTFADPRSGDFAVEELPVGKYRIEVNPLEPAAFEARVFDGIGVPWDGFRDLGAIDLRPTPGASKSEPPAPIDPSKATP